MLDIREYQPQDWDEIATIHDRARLDELRASVGREAFLSLAETYKNEGLFAGEVWVACQDGKVAGFIAFAEDEITWLYVSPEYYRQGIGRKLLQQAIARCEDSVQTSVLSGNDAALNLYLQEGFKIIETKTGRLDGNEKFEATGHILCRQRLLNP